MSETGSPLPRLSVVVPYFNSGRHLRACIESLLALAAEPGEVELIFVDNGSSDDSAAIAAGFEGVIRLQESTPGAYAARNTGIRAARAPIIAFTDADCTVDPDWAKVILARLADPAVGVLIGHCRYPESATLPLRLLAGWENAKAAYITESCGPQHRIAYNNNMAVRAGLFDELGPFLEWRRAADSEFVHRLAHRRPDLALAYVPAMRITHNEFTRAPDRGRRLRLYTQTNARIEGFRELSLGQRLALLWRWLRSPP